MKRALHLSSIVFFSTVLAACGDDGDPTRGAWALYGRRANLDELRSNPTPPERIKGQFEEMEIPEKYTVVEGIDHGRATFGVAQAWIAFHKAITTNTETYPNFGDVLKIHDVWDAAEESVKEKRWVDVKYSAAK